MRDYLGNITHVYNSSNSTTQEYSFDAWGRRRNPTDWSYDLTSQPELFAGRGFTSHEHLPWFNLVNMNGRLYDPAVGRFISPDNFVQDPGNSQSYNRYSYCLNNPLKYTDISGNTWWSHFWGWAGENVGSIITGVYLTAAVVTCFINPVLGGAMIGAYLGGLSTNSGQMNAGAWDWKDPATYCGIIMGGTLGAVGGYWALHQEAFILNIGLSSQYARALVSISGVAAATGKGTDWQYNFNWSTYAGGGGSYNLSGSQPPTAEQVTENAIAEARAKSQNKRNVNSSFNDYLSATQNRFSSAGNAIDMTLPFPQSYAAKLYYFKEVNTHDLYMNPKADPASPFNRIGDYNGHLMRPDDFGNYNYGVAARALVTYFLF